MSSLLFHAQNKPGGPPPKVVVHPYIYSRTASTITIGVYCESPAPENDTATGDITFTHLGIGNNPPLIDMRRFQVPIIKGLRDSGSRAVITTGASYLSTTDLYTNTPIGIGAFGTNLYEAGAKDVCPTMLFNVGFHVDLSSSSQLPKGKYFNPFSAGHLSLDPSNVLFESSDVGDVSGLIGPQSSYAATKSVEISRAAALQVLSSKLNLLSDFTVNTNLLSYDGYAQYLLRADGINEQLQSATNGFSHMKPGFTTTFGSPLLGDYIHMGVSIFDLQIYAEEINTYL